MVTKTKPSPRKMMEKAIEVMRLSVAQQRADGKPNPLVGAVLVRPDGSIESAARGELREGNHAEFTLLERKCVGEKLDGSVLFATLEPCLNRDHPKRGCARHIVSARIENRFWADNPISSSSLMKRHMRISQIAPNTPPKWRDRRWSVRTICESRQISRHFGGTQQSQMA